MEHWISIKKEKERQNRTSKLEARKSRDEQHHEKPERQLVKRNQLSSKGAEKNGPKSSNAPEELTKNRRERSKSTNEDVSTRDQPENSEEHQPLSNPGNKYLQEAIKLNT